MAVDQEQGVTSEVVEAAATLLTPPAIAGASLKTLAKKLATVMGKVEWIPKRGHNTFHNYRYATEADILAAVSKALSEQGVMLFTRLIGFKREATKTPNGKATFIWFVDVEFTFVDAESGESLTTPWVGIGEDPGDKGLYKGLTGATKYFMLKTFLIATGDDPEDDTDDGDERDRRREQPGRGHQPPARRDDRQPEDEQRRPAAVEPTIPKDGIYTPLQLKHVEKDKDGQPIVFGILTAELGDWMLETKDRDVARALVEAKKAGRKVVIEWSTVNGHRVIDQIASPPAANGAAA